MPLTDTAIKASKPRATAYKIADGGGLFLTVTPSGGRLWRMKFRHAGKEGLLSFGAYPEISLKDARSLRDDARKLLAHGRNPALEKRRAAEAAVVGAANTFKAVADELITKSEAEGQADRTITKARWLLTLLDSIAGRPIAEIEPYELLAALKRVEATGRHESAVRALSFASRVFRYAIATQRAPRDMAADLRGALTAPRVKHYAAIIEPEGVGELLRAIDGFRGKGWSTKLALRLAPHVFARPGELRQMEWAEVDLDESVWAIPAGKMKMRRPHVVPLSSQVVALLKEAQPLSGKGRFVFPGIRTPLRPLSENTLNAALRRLGYGADEMTTHGFRSTASTLLNESGKWSPDAIERALAHTDDDKVRAAYHRGAHWKERVAMAQWWSDHLDALRAAKRAGPKAKAA
jgi:integrase